MHMDEAKLQGFDYLRLRATCCISAALPCPALQLARAVSLVMALYARRKLVQLHEDTVNQDESNSLTTKLEAHCHNLGRALSCLQPPHIRLRQRESLHNQGLCRRRTHHNAASSPFATMTFAALSDGIHTAGERDPGLR